MDEVKVTLIEIRDKYGEICLGDSANKRTSKERKPKGHVKIVEKTSSGDKLVYESDNLVLYLGREFAASRLFNVDDTNISPTKDEFICWFGLGSGGVTPGDPLDPMAPVNDDPDLAQEVPISTTDSSYADYHDGAYYKHPIDSVTFLQDDANEFRWLVAQVVTTIGPADANGQLLSEAGLFSAESHAGGYTGPFHIYARVTFPTIVKDSTRQLVFVWYFYF